MADILVTGKKISDMDLATEINGDEKIPTGSAGDVAITPDQLVEYTRRNTNTSWGKIVGDIDDQLDLKNKFLQASSSLSSHVNNKENPHEVTKAQVGLGNVDNTSDLNKPVSSATQTALSAKADKSYVDTELDLKAEKDYVDQELEFKSDTSYVNEKLSLKADIEILKDLEENVKSSEILKFDQNLVNTLGGYPLNSRVLLENGSIVKNISDGNTNNPNLNMTGWGSSEIRISPRIFGADESKTDSTEALRSAHTYANAMGMTVDYSGISSLNVQADAKIILNSNVDFSHCQFNLLNSVKTSLSWSEPFNELFHVYDENFPLQDISVNSSNLQEWYKGSLSFGRYTVFDGYLKLTYTNYLFPNRSDDGTKPLTIGYCLNHGMATQGLELDSRTLISGITAKARLSPKSRISLQNFFCNMDLPNKQTLFRIKRNRVDLSASWSKTTDQNCINTLLFVDDAADVNILRAEGRGSDNINNVGTYALYTFGAAYIRVQKLISHLGWGQIATHFTNDIRTDNIVSRRIDAHEQVFNFKGSDLKLSNSIQYGNGGGDWFFENVDFSLNPNATTLDIIAARSDYGKHFFGKITVRDSVFNCLDSTFAKIVNFQNMGASSMLTDLPDIEIDGLKINITQTDANPNTYANRLSLIHLTVDGTKQAKIAKKVKIKNVEINAFDGFKFYALLNFGMFFKNGDNILDLRDISSQNAAIFQPNLINNRLSSGGYSTAKLKFIDFSKNIKVDFSSADSGIKDYLFNNCYLTKCASTAQDWPLNFSIRNCILDYTTTTDKLCGPYNSATSTRDYLVYDSVILGDPDVSKFTGFSGTVVRKYTFQGSLISSTPTLPSGSTLNDLFLGWRDTSWYK